MKKIIVLLFVLGFAGQMYAQVEGGIHKKLAKFWVEEKWEDCAFKADRMILQGKYQKDAEVYLYLGASYCKIFLMCLEDSTLMNKIPDYANAYKYALKYSVYAKKKDKKVGFYFPENNFMLEDIAIAGIIYIDHYLEIGKKPKANSYMRKIMKTHKDINVYFMHGVLSAMTGDSINSDLVLHEVFDTMDIKRPTDSKRTEFMMIQGFDMYTQFLLNRQEPLTDSARNMVNRGLKYFPDNEVLLYDLELIDNPELEKEKPENILKKEALESIWVSLPDDENAVKKDDDEEYDEDE